MSKERLKILVLVDTFYPVVGGVSSVADQSCIALSEVADVTLGACYAKGYTDPERPYKIVRCKGYYNKITNDGMAHPEFDKNFRKMVEEGDFDLIHCHTAGNFMTYARRVSKKLDIPLVTCVHLLWHTAVKDYLKFDFLVKPVVKIFLNKINKCDYVYTVSNFCKNALIPYGLRQDTKVMYNATSLLPNNREQARKRVNEKYNLDENIFVMSFVSRIIKSKGIDLVIDAINLLKNKKMNFKVFIVGDGNYLDKSLKKIKDLGLEDYFVSVGMVKDRNLLVDFYQRTDLLLFPSPCDAAGLIQVEGAGCTTPTLTIENVAQSEMMVNFKNGLVAKNNPEDYAKYIEYAYNNREVLREIGENAYETLYKYYYDPKTIDELVSMYLDVIKKYESKRCIKREQYSFRKSKNARKCRKPC